MTAARITLPELEQYLAKAADILRGSIDQADFKAYIFPLMFFKRISDVYLEEYEQALDESGGDPEFAAFAENHRFAIPEGNLWGDVRNHTESIGTALQTAFREIEKVQVEIPQGDETIVLDAQTIEDLMLGKRTDVPIDEIEKRITARIARHLNNPVFIELGQRLNALREKYADIQQSSLDFLRELLVLARDTVAAEKAIHEVPREERGKAALTELFEALKGEQTPIIVENVVNRIDEVVRGVRFEGWQSTIRGDQEVRQAPRKTLYVQFKIRDNDVYEKSLGYVREYY